MKAGEKINEFIQRNRKGILGVLSVFVVLFAVSVIFLFLNEHFHKKATAQVEELNGRFSEVRFFLTEDVFADEIESILADENAFAKEADAPFSRVLGKTGYPAGRAWAVIAMIHSGREEWAMAEEAWIAGAKAASKTYLAPAALFNAAAAAEEQGKLEDAIELLQECISHPVAFVSASRAQFSIGRINEQLGNYSEALEAYRAVMTMRPVIGIWSNLAQSRIIAIETL